MSLDFYPVLENERVLLRPLQQEDAMLLWPVANDPDLWKLTSVVIAGMGDMSRYVANALKEREAGISIPFLVFDKRAQQVAGSTRFCSLAPAHKRTEVGSTWLGKQFQGSGLNKNMKLLMLQYAFEVMGMNRVELKTDERNLRSQQAMLGIGAKKEGILRNHMIHEDGWVRNSVYFGIIRQEWPETKAQLLKKL
jgi:RimJ/RimL family protein N-acetyltransferase